jgi:hypothetical protein
MEDKTKKIKVHPILDMAFRLGFVFIAATCFFHGLQDWRDEQYLQSSTYFFLTIAELILIFKWNKPKSKVIDILMWSAIVIAFVFLALSKLL